MLARAPACASPSSPTTTTRSSAASPSTCTGRPRARRARPRGHDRHRPPAAHARRSPTRTSARSRDEAFEVVRTGRRRAALRQRLADAAHRARRSCGSCAASSAAATSTSCTCTRPTTRACSRSRRSRCRRARSASAPTTPSSRRARCSTSFAPILRARSAGCTRTSSSRRRASARSRPTSPFDWRVIPNGIDERHFSPDAEPIPSCARAASRSSCSSGASIPATASARCSRRSSTCMREHEGAVRLCVVGDGPLRHYYQRRSPERVAADVDWAGRVDWSRPRYYASADVLCTPCQRASFGMVLLEAMSCGRPVVASRISGFQLLMEHGARACSSSPADDANRFAAGAAYLLDRPAERARMGREGRPPPSPATPGRPSPCSSSSSTTSCCRSGARLKKRAGSQALRRCSALMIARRRRARGRRRLGARRLGGLGALRRSSACSCCSAWASFTPNSPLFGRVVTAAARRPRARPDVRRRAVRRVDAPRARRAARRAARERRSSCSAGTPRRTPRSSAASARRATRSPRTATTTRC